MSSHLVCTNSRGQATSALVEPVSSYDCFVALQCHTLTWKHSFARLWNGYLCWKNAVQMNMDCLGFVDWIVWNRSGNSLWHWNIYEIYCKMFAFMILWLISWYIKKKGKVNMHVWAICMSASVEELLFEGIFHLVKYTGHY